jgi:DNA segregation ATPase FtsK/SpoIIIE, S-DNA-T family
VKLERRDADDRLADAVNRRQPMWLLLARWLVRRLARGLVWALTHPRTSITCALLLAWRRWAEVSGWGWPLAVLCGALGGLAALAYLSLPARRRIHGLWRRLWIYRREWQPAMVGAGLIYGRRLPHLGAVTSGGGVDRVRVRILPGQIIGEWNDAAEQLARTFGVLSVRARPLDTGRSVELVCLSRDPLAAPVPVPKPDTPPNLAAVPVGIREDGRPLTLPLLGSHLLVAGETGAGKGSVLWSLICGIAPAVSSGLARLWVIDPKGGMELTAGAPLFDRFAHGSLPEYVTLLEEAVAGMRSRAARLRGVTRKLEPTPEEPLVVIVVDELASLTAYVEDPVLRRRAAAALSLLLSQGRAPGVCVVAATQDARKEVVGMRDLFPVRVALRTAEPAQADLILGRGARDRGALTEAIPDSSPGIGYVVVEDTPEPVRVRFGYADDAQLAVVAQTFGGHVGDFSTISG